MIFRTKKIVPLLLVLIIRVMKESVGSRMKPILNVNGSERIINEGETIELECTGDEGVVFHYPENNPQTSVPHFNTSSKNTSNGGKRHIGFRINSTTFQNTGYYGCAYNGSEFKENIYRSWEATWIYIYVRSSQSFFVRTKNKKTIGYMNHKAVIPCRPTSPNYNVTLFYEDPEDFDYKEVQCNDKIIFDPKFGFEIKNLSMKDEGRYQCRFIEEGKRPFQTYTFNLLVYDPPSLEIKRASEFAIEGQKFSLECRIRGLSTYPGPQLRWIVANGDIYENSTSSNDRITSNLLVSKIRSDSIDLTSFLIIKNLTSSDEGNYASALLSNGYLISDHTHLKVYDSNTQFIKLTSLNKTKSFDVCFGVTLVFAAKIDVHPDIRDIKIEWLRFGNEKITTSKEYDIIDGLRNFTQLTIKNVKKRAEESNLYAVRVSNSVNISARLNFLLQIWSPPIVNFNTQPSYYEPFSKVEFECDSRKPPETNITWYFQTQSRNELDKEPKLLQNAVVQEDMSIIASRISLQVNSTGNITCKVCNVVKCEKKEKLITVAGEILRIEKFPEEMIEGNNVSVTCTGSTFDYTKIAWYNRGHEEIKENDRIKFSVQNLSNYRRSSMSIDSVSKTDEQAYVCGATTKNGLTFFKKVKLSVEARDIPSPPPVVIQSNMNGTEVSYDAKTAAQMTINLTCYVEGLQKPNISWSKDGEYIGAENRTFRFFDGKQLLRITHPDKTCTGLYRCLVDGSEKALLKIVIKEEPLEWRIIVAGTVSATCIVLGILGAIAYCKMKQKKSKPADPVMVGNYAFFNYELVPNDPKQIDQLISKWQFSRDKLRLGKRLGIGQFGQVMQGTAHGITAPDTVTVGAVKMARKLGGPLATMALESEFRILCHIGKHLNVLGLLGVVRDVEKGLLLVVEFCRYGSFEQYLLKCRENFFSPLDIKEKRINQAMQARLKNKSNIQGRNTRRDYAYSQLSRHASPDIDELDAVRTVIIDPDCPPNLHRDYASEIILPEDLLIWAYQVALGMEYVSRKKVVHGDLAARNILLAENNIVKIGDFGLAKKLYQTNYYRKKDDTPLPVKWMAIESIRENIFTSQSDVWSYGVVLWEIFTLADPPYPGFTKPQEIYEQLSTGYRMPKAKYMTDEISTIMCQCWENEPTSRPTFSQLAGNIGNMLPDHVAKYFIALNGSTVDSQCIQDRNSPNSTNGNGNQVSNGCENQASAEITLNVVAGCSKDLNSVVVHCDHEGVVIHPSKMQNSQHSNQSTASSENCCEQLNSNVESPTSYENVAYYSENPNYESADGPS